MSDAASAGDRRSHWNPGSVSDLNTNSRRMLIRSEGRICAIQDRPLFRFSVRHFGVHLSAFIALPSDSCFASICLMGSSATAARISRKMKCGMRRRRRRGNTGTPAAHDDQPLTANRQSSGKKAITFIHLISCPSLSPASLMSAYQQLTPVSGGRLSFHFLSAYVFPRVATSPGLAYTSAPADRSIHRPLSLSFPLFLVIRLLLLPET